MFPVFPEDTFSHRDFHIAIFASRFSHRDGHPESLEILAEDLRESYVKIFSGWGGGERAGAEGCRYEFPSFAQDASKFAHVRAHSRTPGIVNMARLR